MTLLFDENLPQSLVRSLDREFPGSSHVASHGMLHAQDLEVWELAKEKSLCIVSKDRDFAALAGLHIPPPKVIWLRVGNCATVEVRQLILKHAEILREFLDSDEANIIVLPPGLMS